MKHFTHIADLGVGGVQQVLARAAELKAGPQKALFSGKVLAMLFFNPSLRTRVSFETAMLRGGGHAVVLNAGQDNWKIETARGAVMNGDKPEHLRDGIPVLASYVDALAVRSFAANADRDEDEQDALLREIRALSSVPVISMESAREHPCQGLADMLTIAELARPSLAAQGSQAMAPAPLSQAMAPAPLSQAMAPAPLRGRKLTLCWAPHIKPLPLAVPHSFILSAAACGAQITVAHPPGFELHPAVLAEAEGYAKQSGANISFTHDQAEACANAEVLYAKSWGPLESGGAAERIQAHADWLVDLELLKSGVVESRLMHCLPVRRNVEVADDALDSPLSLTVGEAYNRYSVQVALLDMLLNGGQNAG